MSDLVTIEDWPSMVSSLLSFIKNTVSFSNWRVISLIIFHIIWYFLSFYKVTSKLRRDIMFLTSCAALSISPYMNIIFLYLGFSPSYLTAALQFSFAFWAFPMFVNCLVQILIIGSVLIRNITCKTKSKIATNKR